MAGITKELFMNGKAFTYIKLLKFHDFLTSLSILCEAKLPHRVRVNSTLLTVNIYHKFIVNNNYEELYLAYKANLWCITLIKLLKRISISIFASEG